jgi:DNA-binding GntR family transcriptional regulator
MTARRQQTLSHRAPGTTPLDALLAGEGPPGEDARRKGALHGGVVGHLRSLIITGTLAPGERLNERELCERLGVSRTPVREAIRTLTQEGLLTARPNRSPVVAPLDAAEVSALVEVVAAVEALAGELAATKLSDADLAELGILHYTMMRHHARDELPGYFEANKAFHRRIVEGSGNPVLLWIWELLALRVDRARFASNLWPTRWKKATDEHAGILEKLSARDAAGAAAAMRAHVRNGLSVVVASLSETDPQPTRRP